MMGSNRRSDREGVIIGKLSLFGTHPLRERRGRTHALPASIETGEPPLCHCGGFLKPATISFGQQLNASDVARAFETAKRADLVIALGSTLGVTPAADIPLKAAASGAGYAIVNRGATEHDGLPLVTLRIEGDVGAVFPPAVQLALQE